MRRAVNRGCFLPSSSSRRLSHGTPLLQSSPTRTATNTTTTSPRSPSIRQLSTTRASTSATGEKPKTRNDTEKKSSLLDREAVNTESNEYSKSGSDDGAAAQEDPAFTPGKTDPDSELGSSQTTGKGRRDPLEISPANHKASQPRMPDEGGAESGPERRRGSGGGGGEVKAGKVR